MDVSSKRNELLQNYLFEIQGYFILLNLLFMHLFVYIRSFLIFSRYLFCIYLQLF